jgi:copper chaperone
MNGSQPILLRVEGMHCQSCVRRLSAALGRLEGVEVVAVEVGSARLLADRSRRNRILEAVAEAGFAGTIQDDSVPDRS